MYKFFALESTFCTMAFDIMTSEEVCTALWGSHVDLLIYSLTFSFVPVPYLFVGLHFTERCEAIWLLFLMRVHLIAMFAFVPNITFEQFIFGDAFSEGWLKYDVQWFQDFLLLKWVVASKCWVNSSISISSLCEKEFVLQFPRVSGHLRYLLWKEQVT